MTTRNIELINLLNGAAMPDPDLDRAVGLAIGWLHVDPDKPQGHNLYYLDPNEPPDGEHRVYGGLGDYTIIPPYTSSLDCTRHAASRLGLEALRIEREGCGYRVVLRWKDNHMAGAVGVGKHPDMIMALVIALLRVDLE